MRRRRLHPRAAPLRDSRRTARTEGATGTVKLKGRPRAVKDTTLILDRIAKLQKTVDATRADVADIEAAARYNRGVLKVLPGSVASWAKVVRKDIHDSCEWLTTAVEGWPRADICP